MAEMSSFYGGRQGNSIVLAKRFDGIDIPQSDANPVYTRGFYAIDKNGKFLITRDSSVEGATPVSEGGELSTTVFLIKKTTNNYLGTGIDNFSDWEIHDNDGTQINDSEYTFYPYLAQGMVQFFAEGAKTSTEVNYGAYVIIDTITGMANYNDPDNGKVYRRGMNINAVDGLAGAEYLGQIVGPQGETPEVDINTYANTLALDPHQERTYNVSNGGIVQGSTMVGSTRTYEDEIKYVWATMRDAAGNVKGCRIGFSFPTLVQEFYADSLSPYKKRAKNSEGKYYNYDLITEDPDQFDTATGKWKHPFYQQWKIDVPHGYHGINSDSIEIIHSFTKPLSYKGSAVNVYNDINCTSWSMSISESVRVLGSEYVFVNDASDIDSDDSDASEHLDKIKGKYYIRYGSEYNADPAVVGCPIKISGLIKYVKKEDCYMDILRYKETDFDDEEKGIDRYFYLGDYDVIDRVTISEDGTLTVFYTAKAQPKELEQVLRWIDTKDTKGITIAEDGTVRIYYNTLHETSSGTTEHDYQEYPTVLDWITSATLTQDGKFTVVYNNDTAIVGHDVNGNPTYGDTYTARLNWIDYVDLSADGTITFRWNSDTTRTGIPAYQFKKVIKYIDNVQMQDKKSGSTYEGTGDQKLYAIYNTGATEAVSAPLNYIVETRVCVTSESYPNAPYYHLLVYYSDPAKRASLKDKWVTYPSSVVIDSYTDTINSSGDSVRTPNYHVWTEWVDLGEVKGSVDNTGIRFLKNVATLDELKDSDGNWIPPEQITDANGTVINGNGGGWCCTMGDDTQDDSGLIDGLTILCYDYNDKKWYVAGNLSSGSTGSGISNPKSVIVKSTPDASMMPSDSDVGLLQENGFWLAEVECKFAN